MSEAGYDVALIRQDFPILSTAVRGKPLGRPRNRGR